MRRLVRRTVSRAGRATTPRVLARVLAAACLLGATLAGRAGAQQAPQGTPPAPKSPPTGAPRGQDPPTMNMDRMIRTFLLTEVLETTPGAANVPIEVDATGWIGGDYNRVFFNLDAQQPLSGRGNDIRGDVNYGRLISPFWSALVGVRVETRSGEVGNRQTRGLLALQLEGLAPGFFTMEPSLYVSPQGDISARLATTIDLLFTQRLIFQPRLEAHAAVQKVPSFLVGSGLNDIALSGRLRYEFRRDLAPYVGVQWSQRAGGAAALSRRAGEAVRDLGLVAGLRVWY